MPPRGREREMPPRGRAGVHPAARFGGCHRRRYKTTRGQKIRGLKGRYRNYSIRRINPAALFLAVPPFHPNPVHEVFVHDPLRLVAVAVPAQQLIEFIEARPGVPAYDAVQSIRLNLNVCL